MKAEVRKTASLQMQMWHHTAVKLENKSHEAAPRRTTTEQYDSQCS